MRRLPLMVLLLFGLASRSVCEAADNPLPEYQVKAVFLLNFTKFIEWPDAAFANPEAPINICVLGDDPFGQVLDSTVAGERIGSRRLVVQRTRRLLPKSCQVVFVGRSEKDLLKLLAGVGPGVLTVGEGEGFLREGGIIAFVVENRRVRFDVNQAAASNASLKISSKLLNVARSVEK
jgi:hypothetical protein